MQSTAPEKPSAAKRKGDRNAFVRTRVPSIERVISIGIVLLLAYIGGAIWWKGQHFDPGLYSLRTEALNSTKNTLEGKEGTLRQQGPAQAGEEGETKSPPIAKAVAQKSQASESEPADGHEEASSAPASKAAAKGEPLEIDLPGTKPMGATEFYNAENLFEKIDGRAPAYEGFNVQQLRSRSFAVEGAAGSYVDVYEFRMDSPVNAFGIFALERDSNGKPLAFAPDGYSGEMGYFFRQGAIYVQVMASDQNPKTLELAKAIALNRAKTLPADDSGLAGRRKLPAAGLITDTVAYVQENAQGQSSFKDVFQAKYDFDGAKLPFFVMASKPDEAAKAWKSFLDFCGRFGKTESLPDVAGAKLFSAQLFGKWKVVYQREGELGGVFDAEDAGKARAFVEKYLQGEIK